MIADVAMASALVAGMNDYPHFASGWHERETDGRCGVVFRAANGTGELVLRRKTGASRVGVLISGARGLRAESLRGTIRVNDAAYPVELDADLWVVRTFAIPGGEELRLRFEMENAPCPDEVLKNGDGRRLGWFVAAAWTE